MIKITIKSIYGSILFEYEKENNTLKETVENAVKSGADLSGAYLSGAYLSGADLSGADLSGADLSGADLSGIKIKQAIVFTGLYHYVVIPFISEDSVKYVKMGCHTRTVAEWDADFWNNDNEFPNNNSVKSNLRLFAYETAKNWFKIIEQK